MPLHRMSEPPARARRDLADGAEVASAHLELRRLRSAAAFHQGLRDLTLAFSRHVSSAWLHQRRARRLVLAASSDRQYAKAPAEVSADDPCAPAAHGMRLELPAFLQDPKGPVLLAPLRGWRRALGALVVDGPLSADL